MTTASSARAFHHHRPPVQVDRRASLSVYEFYDSYLSTRTPVVLTGAIEHWPARTKWTLDFFAEVCGRDAVAVRREDGERASMKFGEYAQYARAAGGPGDERPLLYLVNWQFQKLHPELWDDYRAPDFAESWFDLFPAPLQPNYRWLFVGPPGTGSRLHVDTSGTHAWLAQLVGRKHWVLFKPGDVPAGLKAPPLTSDFAAIPELGDAQPYEATIGPGDLIFVPYGWKHQVLNLDLSIALTVNYLDASNFADCWARVRELAPGYEKVYRPLLADALATQARRFVESAPAHAARQAAWLEEALRLVAGAAEDRLASLRALRASIAGPGRDGAAPRDGAERAAPTPGAM